jgi:hypothetical protein
MNYLIAAGRGYLKTLEYAQIAKNIAEINAMTAKTKKSVKTLN